MSSPPPREQVTQLLVDWQAGSGDALDKLMPVVYEELRRLARHYLQQERANHTLQATALVHEAYVRLVDHANISWQGRAHFFAVAARTMRRVLVDHARLHRAEKRGGGEAKLRLEDVPDLAAEPDLDLVALDGALENLARLDARQSEIVELRFFGGLTNEEIGEVLEISPRTIKREWRLARAWLRCEMEKEASADHQ